MNQEYNLAGKTLVVEKVKELKGKKSEYIRQVVKTAQNNKRIDESARYSIEAIPGTIERDDTRRDSQTIVLKAVIVGRDNANPRFEINGVPRMCGYHTGDIKEDLIADLQDMMDNQTPFTPEFTGDNNWSRGGSLFHEDDIVSVVYLCSDETYVTALMSVTGVGSDSLTGLVIDILYANKGFDDRDTDNCLMSLPYAQAVPVQVVLYDNLTQMDSLQLEVVNTTRYRRTFGVDPSPKGSTYTEEGVEHNYIEGDSYVSVSVSGDTKTATVMFWFQNAWWVLDDIPGYARYDEILIESLPDVYSIYQAENHVSAAGYDWFKQAVAEHISAIYYFVGGAIYGYGQNGSVDMTQPPGQRAQGDAFIIDANGIMEISQGYARNLNVRSTLNLYADNGTDAGAEILHPALTTVPEMDNADPLGVSVNSSPIAWGSDSLLSAISSLSKNVVGSAAGTFRNKALAFYVNADNLATVLQVGQSVNQVAGNYYSGETWNFTLNPHYKGTLNITISGSVSSVYYHYTEFWGGDEYNIVQTGGVTIKKNGTTVYSKSPVYKQDPSSLPETSYSATFPIKGGDSVSVSVPASRSQLPTLNYQLRAYMVAKIETNTPTVSLADYVGSVGFWLEYSDGSMEKIGSGDSYLQSSNAMVMTSPVSFNSSNYVTLRDVSNFVNYSSFVDSGGVTRNLQIGRMYGLTSVSLVIDGNSVSGIALIRESATSTTIRYRYNSNTYSITLVLSKYYNISGTIKIAKTLAGVEMMGNYPKEDMTYDTGNPEKGWLNGYISNVISPSTLASKTGVTPYERKALDILNATEIVRFRYKADPQRIPHIGFVADYTDSDLAGEKHNSFISNHVIAVCVKAIQELSAEVERLKAESKNNH